MNTIHTSSLTHEIESYGSRQDLISFIRNRYEELIPGGRWINRDVVGPQDKETTVLMKLAKGDGINEDYSRGFNDRNGLASYLRDLSTEARFRRFALDFRRSEGYRMKFEELEIDGETYFRLLLKDACEFMSKKDYVDNWESEMHETFCFWDIEDWKTQLTSAGFAIAEESNAYINTWIVNNRLVGKVELFADMAPPTRIGYPVMNMVVGAIKQ